MSDDKSASVPLWCAGLLVCMSSFVVWSMTYGHLESSWRIEAVKVGAAEYRIENGLAVWQWKPSSVFGRIPEGGIK